MTLAQERKSVLVVDDTPAYLLLMRTILREDYNVYTATSGDMVLELTRGGFFHICAGSGLQLKRLRKDLNITVAIHSKSLSVGRTTDTGRGKAFTRQGSPNIVSPHILPEALQPPDHMHLAVRKMFEEAVAH